MLFHMEIYVVRAEKDGDKKHYWLDKSYKDGEKEALILIVSGSDLNVEDLIAAAEYVGGLS